MKQIASEIGNPTITLQMVFAEKIIWWLQHVVCASLKFRSHGQKLENWSEHVTKQQKTPPSNFKKPSSVMGVGTPKYRKVYRIENEARWSQYSKNLSW